MEKNENLKGEISRKELIKMLSESLSQIIFFNIPNSARPIGSTEKYVNREKFEFSKEKSLVQPKITVKAIIIIMVQLTVNSYNIFSTNCYKNLDANDASSNTTIGITCTDYNRESMNNHTAKKKFNKHHKNIVHRRNRL